MPVVYSFLLRGGGLCRLLASGLLPRLVPGKVQRLLQVVAFTSYRARLPRRF